MSAAVVTAATLREASAILTRAGWASLGRALGTFAAEGASGPVAALAFDVALAAVNDRGDSPLLWALMVLLEPGLEALAAEGA